MAEETAPGPNGGDAASVNASDSMELENSNVPATDVDNTGLEPNSAADGESNGKRGREASAEGGIEVDGKDEASKKKKVEKSEEDERLNKVGEGEKGREPSGPVRLGPKTFASSSEMFNYFYNFVQFWPANLNINKYEHMVLLDLLKKGHPEPDKKIGEGIRAFQVRHHPEWKNLCFFLVRVDDSVDDFSFRKCVDHILPLPADLKSKPDAKKAFHGGKGKGGGGRGRGRGRGGIGGRSQH